MKKILFLGLIVFALIVLSGCNSVQPTNSAAPADSKNIAFFVFDGLSAAYIESYPELYPKLLDESKPGKALTPNLKRLSETTVVFRYLSTLFPSTTPSHAAMYLAGDCGKEENDIEWCLLEENSSLCDAARSQGYLCLMASQSGDFWQARKEFDLVFHDEGKGEWRIEKNLENKAVNELEKFFAEEKKKFDESKKNDFAYYAKYLMNIDENLMKFMNKNFPEQRFLLFSNIKSIDSCGHQRNAKEYIECIQKIDPEMTSLANALLDSNNLVSVVTADHGMQFKCLECRGAHAAKEHRESKEVEIVPLIVVNEKNEKELRTADATHFDLVPTAFGYAGIKNICSKMNYCKGKDLSS